MSVLTTSRTQANPAPADAYTARHLSVLEVLDAVRNNQFWIHPANPRTDDALRQRTQSILDRSQPDNYLRAVPG